MQKLFSLLLVIAVSVHSNAQSPTWGKQISCIIYSHCTSCHNPNGLAPFSLTTYPEAFNRRFAILNSVVGKKMPPYLPDVNYSHLANARTLTDAEKNLISDWVNNGAPAGDTSAVLPPPVYNQTQVITNPDLTARIPGFTVPNLSNDLYQAFVITNPSPVAKFITQVEVMPGNRNIVHHVLVYQDTSNRPVVQDSAYPGPGYVSFGGVGSASAKLVATWVPGSNVYTLPAGMGIKLNAGARLIVQIHYPQGSGGQIDSTRVNMKLSTAALRDVTIAPILNSTNLTNGPLFIPADSVRTFYSRVVVPSNYTAISIGPHAHLLCKKFEVYGRTVAGDTIKLIKIDDWDFHWQGSHSFQKPVKIPAGTVLHGVAFYDNTVNNPDNPNNPPQNVSQGEATTDEMMLIYFAYLPYQAGDENIIIDTSAHNAHYLNCVPEPLALPVSLLSFEATRNNVQAKLTWSTTNEIQLKHYEVERSDDAIRFTPIAKVNVAGNSQAVNHYSYSDEAKHKAVVFYRLKMVDLDGSYTYSLVRRLDYRNATSLSVFPNPLKNGQSIYIQSEHKDIDAIELINNLGQTILKTKHNSSSFVSLMLPTGLQKGMYLIRISTGSNVTDRKLMVE